MTHHTRLSAAILVALALTGGAARAQDDPEASPECPVSNLLGGGMISNICWTCVFPVRLMGVDLFGSSLLDPGGVDAAGYQLSSRPEPPPQSADDPGCYCQEDGHLPRIGMTIGMWQPAEVYETTLIPGCSSFLGGTNLGITDPLYLGTAGVPTEDLEQQSFTHIHTYSYPVVGLMELFTKCQRGYVDIDALYFSEVDPTWNDPFIAIYGNPMSTFGASVPAQAACIPDAISSAVGNPIDELFWCGGTWTSTLAPYTGYNHNMGTMQFTSAAALRLLAMNHVRGINKRMTGDDAACAPTYDPTLNRSDYRWQVAWPNAEASRNHGSGEALLTWAGARWIPAVADMPLYLLWRWTDCCAPIVGSRN